MCFKEHCKPFCGGVAFDMRVSPTSMWLKWSDIRIQLVSPLRPTQSFSLSAFSDLAPENPKSIDDPWCGRVALLAEFGPGGSSVCFDRMQTGHCSRIGSWCLNFGMPSMNLCAVCRRSSDGWPSLWCQRGRSVCAQMALTSVAFFTMASTESVEQFSGSDQS